MPQIYSTHFNKTQKYHDHLQADGVRMFTGTYVGIVKNNVDPKRSGQLQVYITELGGDADDPAAWRGVDYCSPFYGVTPPASERPDGEQDFNQGPHAYGMWMVPPDIGVKVLCIFVAGDAQQGFWIGCIPEFPSLHMVPGLSKKLDDSGDPEPTIEWNDKGSEPNEYNEFWKKPEALHDVQADIWEEQGLLEDEFRGVGTSSAHRETPSGVFGISTPGAKVEDAETIDGEDSSQLNFVRARKGGHQFVMDDGDENGDNRMFRLRSSAGHMIQMNDVEGAEFIYIINSKGTAWIEMDSDGDIYMYSGDGVKIFANGDIDIECDNDMKLHAGNNMDIKADGRLNIETNELNILSTQIARIQSYDILDIYANNMRQTCIQAINMYAPDAITMNSEMIYINSGGEWLADSATEADEPENMPTHEPYAFHKSNAGHGSQAAQPSYASQSGLIGGSGPYGASTNFGSSDVQQNYGVLPQDIGPTKFVSGLQGSYRGQASAVAQSVANNPSYARYDTQATNFRDSGVGLNLNYQSSAPYAAAQLMNQEQALGPSAPQSFLQQQNNPGKVLFSSNDTFAIGNANGYAAYLKPEDGIAAMMQQFYAIQSNNYTTPLQMMSRYLQLNTESAGEAVAAARFITNMTGINATVPLEFSINRNVIAWASAVMQYFKMKPYTYDQLVTACALSRNIPRAEFANSLISTDYPWQNNYTDQSTKGFVSPLTPSLMEGKSSFTGASSNNLGTKSGLQRSGSENISVGTVDTNGAYQSLVSIDQIPLSAVKGPVTDELPIDNLYFDSKLLGDQTETSTQGAAMPSSNNLQNAANTNAQYFLRKAELALEFNNRLITELNAQLNSTNDPLFVKQIQNNLELAEQAAQAAREQISVLVNTSSVIDQQQNATLVRDVGFGAIKKNNKSSVPDLSQRDLDANTLAEYSRQVQSVPHMSDQIAAAYGIDNTNTVNASAAAELQNSRTAQTLNQTIMGAVNAPGEGSALEGGGAVTSEPLSLRKSVPNC